MKVFISHSSYDKWAARQISQQLEEKGHDTFLDEKDITTGDSIDASIQKHLKSSDDLLILISPVSLKSHWVFIEIGGAKALGKRVVPVLFHVEPNEVPSPISQLLARSVNDIDKYYDELEARAEGRRPARPKLKKQPTHTEGGFKVGDRVRLAEVQNLTDEDRRRVPIWTEKMDKYSGAVGQITEISSENNVKLSVDNGQFWWGTRWFTRAE